jgi:phage major head subunit gpT-like protein
MAIHSSSNVSFVLDEVVSSVAYNEFEQAPLLMPALYDVRPGAGRRDRTASLGGLGKFALKLETQDSQQDNIVQQFEKDFVHKAYALNVEVSRELIDDNEFGFFTDLGQQIGMSAARSMEDLGAALFNDAFNGATYLAEDGLSICNSAHLNVDAGNSQDNSLALSLSGANLKTARDTMRAFTDYRGEKISVLPDAIVVPTALEQDAWEIVRSSLKSGTANNDANFFNGMFNMFVWQHLSDSNAWFVIDQRLASRNLLWYQRTPLEIYGDGDLKKGTRTIGGYFRSSHGCRDWRWIVGCNP